MKSNIMTTIVLLLIALFAFSASAQEVKEIDRFDKGIQLINELKYAHAIKFFTHYIDSNPDDAWGYYYRGDTYRRYKRFRHALIDYDKAIKLAPTFVRARKGFELAHRAVTDAPEMLRPNQVFKEIIYVMPTPPEPVVANTNAISNTIDVTNTVSSP